MLFLLNVISSTSGTKLIFFFKKNIKIYQDKIVEYMFCYSLAFFSKQHNIKNKLWILL